MRVVMRVYLCGPWGIKNLVQKLSFKMCNLIDCDAIFNDKGIHKHHFCCFSSVKVLVV